MRLNQNNKVQEYINSVCSQIKNHRVHEEIKMELLSHIEEAAMEYLSMNISEDEAVRKAIMHMGDAELIGKELNKAHKMQPEWSILIITTLLASFGLLTMYFIQTKGVLLYNYQIFNRSLVSTILGVVIIIGLYFFDYRKIQPYSKYIYIGTLLVLIYTVIFGTRVNGLRAWLTVGPLNINFVGISPLLFTISLAGLLDNWDWNKNKKALFGIILCTIPAIFMLIAPSFSSCITYSITFFVLIIISGIKLKHIILIAGSGIGLFLYSIIAEPYRLTRLLFFINYNKDPNGIGWIGIQLNKITHSAGILGKGFTLTPGTLPEIHTQFIFSYIVYTFGWIIGIILAMLITIFLLRIANIAKTTKDNYGKLLASGFVTAFTIQFLLNILMNLNLAPISGIGLPFISFGGSQFICNILAIGIITNIYKLKNVHQITL